MKRSCVPTFLVAVAVGSLAIGVDAHRSRLQGDTLAAAKSAKADAYQNFRVATGVALKAFAADKPAALAATAESEKGWQAEYKSTAAPDVARRVAEAFAGLKKAVESGTTLDYHIARQVIDKSMLGQVITEVDKALKAKKADEANAWLQVYVTKFLWDKTASEAVPVLKAATAAPDAARTRQAVLALHKHIAAEAIGEVAGVAEQLEKKGNDRAQVLTTEGRVFFLGIQADYNTRVSKAEGDRVLEAFDGVMAASKAGDIPTAKAAVDRITVALTKYQALVTQAMSAGGAKD